MLNPEYNDLYDEQCDAFCGLSWVLLDYEPNS